MTRTILAALLLAGCGAGEPPPPAREEPAPEPSRAEAAAGSEVEPSRAPPPLPPIALDTHVDTTQRMLDDGDDIAERLPDGHLDLPRMRQGGLTGAFFSIWVRPERYPGEQAWDRARALIGAVRQLTERHPEAARLCTSAEDVVAAAREGRAAILMGIEGAHALGDASDDVLIERLAEAYRLGVRYMTVTWSNDNRFGHSSGGSHPSRGLTELGRRAVREMNRLGMIVDVSHVSDRTFEDVMDATARPVLATHSSCRALSDHPRNMTDAMIRRVADAGGAVCINYYTSFLDAEYGARRRALAREHAAAFRAIARQFPSSRPRDDAENGLVRSLAPDIGVPTLATLVRHFEHAVGVAGARGVCLGSDYDGVGELPIGMEDVSRLPALREALAARELDVGAIFGGNVLRVLRARGGTDPRPVTSGAASASSRSPSPSTRPP